MLHDLAYFTVYLDNININNTKFKEQHNTNFNYKEYINDFSLGICLTNLNNKRLNDFYIMDNQGLLHYEVTPDRKILIKYLLQLRDQKVNNILRNEDWLISKIGVEVTDIYTKSSKIYSYLWQDINRLSFLNLENHFFQENQVFQTLHRGHENNELLLQSASLQKNIQTDNIDIQLDNKDISHDTDIEIDKQFINHQLKSKRRRNSLPKRFSFDVKNSINLATPDNRSPLQLFEAVLKKLHKQYRHDEIDQLCASCNYDITIPQVTKNHVFLGNHFIKSLIRKFKRSPDISYGQPDRIKKILQELGFNNTEIYNVLYSETKDNENNLFEQLPKEYKSNNVKLNNKKFNLNNKQTKLKEDFSTKTSHLNNQIFDPLSPKQTSRAKSSVKSNSQINQSNSSNPEILAQQANVETLNNAVFNILDSLKKHEISNKNDYAFKLLASFIRKNSTFFQEKDPDIFKRYLKNTKRYFRLGIYSLNKRARKLIKHLFFAKSEGQFTILKDHLISFFRDQNLIFKDAPTNFQNILLQQAITRNGTVPYLTLRLGERNMQFTLDTGCSQNLLTSNSYNLLKHLESHSYAANNISLRTIDNTISNNVVSRITFIPLTIEEKTFQIKFYVGKKIDRNFLGTSFLVETQASMVFQKDKNCHNLLINNKTFSLDFLYLTEIMANNAFLDSSTADCNLLSADNNTKAENLIKENLSFTQTAFKMFGSESNLNSRVTEILNQYDCIPTEEISAASGDLDYDTLAEYETYPAPEMQEYIEKRIYLPNFGEDQKEPFFFENGHLTSEQTNFLKNIINDHKNAISTKTDPLGNFKLFQIAINFFPGKTAHQVKRNIDFDLVNQDISRMLHLGIISENFSTDIPTLSNLVIVSKASRLCKADRFVQKRQEKLDKNLQTPEKTEKNQTLGSQKDPQYRLTIDLSDTNAILFGQKYINLAKYESILENLQDCYLSKLDLAEYFFSFNLDQKSKNKINFYFKNKIYSFNKLPQGISIAPFFSVLGTNLSFSLEGLKLFLETFPELKNEEVFKITDITKLVLFYIDDSLVYTKKQLGWKSHFLVIKYILWTFDLVGLKVKLEKCQFLVFETKFLGLYLNTEKNCHYIPEKKLAAMQLWPVPTSTGELNSRLSCINFYSKYVPFFKNIAFPLIQLAKSEKFKWTQIDERAWAELKFLLKFALKLHFVQSTDRLLIFTDSSILAAGFTLVKCDSNLHFYPILAESRLFIKSEKRQSIVYKEALSLLLSLERCEKYIKGNFNKILLFSDAISLSQIQRLKNTSSKLYELSLLISSYPNLQITFLKGKYNSMADLISRTVFDAIIKDNITDSDILSISHDVTQLMDQDVISLNHESLQEYLLNNNSSKYIDLLTNKKRIFHIKKSYLRETSPLNTASERELLFLLLNSSNFDLRHLNLNVLKDYLMTLNKTKISKNVLQDFVKYTMSKVSSECLQQLFPMDKAQKDDFLAEAQFNNCPDFLKSQCKNLTHPLETKIKNISLTKDHNWVYSKQPKNTKMDSSIDILEQDQIYEVNSATISSSSDKKEEINKFLYSSKCEHCKIASSNVNCKFKTAQKMNLLETIKELFLTIDKLQNENFNLSTHNLIHFQEIFSNLCFQATNLTKLMMVIYFGTISIIEDFFKLEMNLSSMGKLSPIFYHCNTDFTLQINNHSVNESIIEIYLTQCLTIDQFSEQTKTIDLNLLLNTDCYLQSCVVGSVICLAPNVERYPNLLVIKEVQLLNFEETSISIDITQPILTLHIYYPDKEFQILQVQKIMFEGLYTNLIDSQQFNSTQYLSSLLSKQLLNQNEFQLEKNQKAKILQCNSALLGPQKEDLLNIYEKNLKDIENLDHLFNLIFVSKSDFDKRSFILAQRLNFPKLYSKAENNTSIKFVLQDGILKNNYKGKLKTVLPNQIIESTFLTLHLKGIHNLDSLIKNKILANFYSPVKNMNQSIKKALKGCLNCNVLTPANQKRFLGLKRNLNECLQSGKNLYIDITYVKTNNITNYLFLVCDQASSFIICKLFNQISVQKVTDYLMDLHGIISLTNCIISDSGAEHSQLLTDSLMALGVQHKRISPGASHQNSAESSIKLFRHSLKKLVNNSSQNGLKMDFAVLQKLCLIAANLVNETPSYSSFYSRKELFFGYYFFQKNHNMNRYISESSLLENTNDLILFKNIQKFYDYRISVLTKQGEKTNKKVKGIFFKRGDIVIHKSEKNKNLLYDPQKVYYAVLRIENPRCRTCIDSIDL